jgi:hypothetical protein
MLDALGPLGWAGIVVLLAGLGLIAYADPLVAAGVGIVLLGLGLLVKRGVDMVMAMMGMA